MLLSDLDTRIVALHTLVCQAEIALIIGDIFTSTWYFSAKIMSICAKRIEPSCIITTVPFSINMYHCISVICMSDPVAACVLADMGTAVCVRGGTLAR